MSSNLSGPGSTQARGISRRSFLKTALTVSGASLLAACAAPAAPTAEKTTEPGGAPAPAEKGTLTVWGWTGTFEGIKAMVPKFNEKFPDVAVDIKEQGYDDIHTNLLNAIVSGAGAPDLCAIDCLRLWKYTDGLVDLSNQAGQFKDQFVVPTYSVGSFRGKFYGIATDSEPMGFFYRTDLWDQYGLQPDSIKTWADLAAAGNKLSEDTKGDVNLYHMNSGADDLFQIMALEAGFPGYYFSEDDSKVIVDDPKMVEAATALKTLWDGKGVLRNPADGSSGDEVTAALKNGKLISQIIAPAWYPEDLHGKMPELSGKWKLMRAPAINADGKRVGYQWPTIIVMSSQSKMKDTAWELDKISLIGDGAKALYEASHVLPAYKPLLDEIKDQPSEYFGGQLINQLWLEIAADTPPVTFGYGFDEVGSIVGTHLQDLLDAKVGPDQAMKDAAAEIRTKFKKG